MSSNKYSLVGYVKDCFKDSRARMETLKNVGNFSLFLVSAYVIKYLARDMLYTEEEEDKKDF